MDEIKNLIETLSKTEINELNNYISNKNKNLKIVSKNITPENTMVNIINNLYNEQENKNFWNNSLYKLSNLLKNDYSGNIGEIFLAEFCKSMSINHIYNKNIIAKDGVYDIIINNKKVEIKTARIGLTKTFQHENLRNDGSDYHIMIDITPKYFYITILEKFDLRTKNNILNKKAHLRKGSDNIYKLDFSQKELEKFIIKNITIKCDSYMENETLENFINKSIK
jgi:hypothetical protein